MIRGLSMRLLRSARPMSRACSIIAAVAVAAVVDEAARHRARARAPPRRGGVLENLMRLVTQLSAAAAAVAAEVVEAAASQRARARALHHWIST